MIFPVFCRLGGAWGLSVVRWVVRWDIQVRQGLLFLASEEPLPWSQQCQKVPFSSPNQPPPLSRWGWPKHQAWREKSPEKGDFQLSPCT